MAHIYHFCNKISFNIHFHFPIRYGGFSFGEIDPLAEFNHTLVDESLQRLSIASNGNTHPGFAMNTSQLAELVQDVENVLFQAASRRNTKVIYNQMFMKKSHMKCLLRYFDL